MSSLLSLSPQRTARPALFLHQSHSFKVPRREKKRELLFFLWPLRHSLLPRPSLRVLLMAQPLAVLVAPIPHRNRHRHRHRHPAHRAVPIPIPVPTCPYPFACTSVIPAGHYPGSCPGSGSCPRPWWSRPGSVSGFEIPMLIISLKAYNEVRETKY
jgi:hypothetical protein